MAWLQNIRIQNKLIGIFLFVSLIGAGLMVWNAVAINHSRNTISEALTSSKQDVRTTLETKKEDVTSTLNSSMDDADAILSQMDTLLILQIIEIDFRVLEALEKDLVMFDDIDRDYVDEITENYEFVVDELDDYLDTVLEWLPDEESQQFIHGLQEQRVAQGNLFYQLADLMFTDPDEARNLSDEATANRIDNIYDPLVDRVGTDWDATFDDFDQTWQQVEDTIQRTEAEMQGAIENADSNLQSAIDATNSDLKRALNIGLLTLGLFVVGSVMIVVLILVVSRQLVQPVLTMSEVAQGIEQESFDTVALDPIVHRQDEIGVLARVFQRMANEVHARMEQLKQQVAELQIVIDTKKVSEQVSEITDSDYFQNLQAKARQLRQRGDSAASTDEPSS